jgi:hypothetical protein
MEHLDGYLAADGIELSSDVLDRIDEIVPFVARWKAGDRGGQLGVVRGGALDAAVFIERTGDRLLELSESLAESATRPGQALGAQEDESDDHHDE